jgi:hypothetical protein
MYKTNIPLALCLFLSLCGAAQGKHDNVWLFGRGSNDPSSHLGGTMLDFSGGEPEATFFPLPPKFDFQTSCSFSDSEGKLLLYANGCKIVNADHEVIANGDGLGAGASRSYFCEQSPYYASLGQSDIFLPKPGRPDRCYYLHSMYDLNLDRSYLLYTEIDLSANGGKGAVTETKNRLLRVGTNDEGYCSAVRHGNGRDWWVVSLERGANRYDLYLVSPEGISGPFVQDFQGWGFKGDPGYN